MKTHAIKLTAYVQTMLKRVEASAKKFAREEAGGSEIIAVVAVAAVAVLLAFVFQEQVGNFISTTVQSFTDKVKLG